MMLTPNGAFVLRLLSRIAMLILSAVIYRVARAPRRGHAQPER